MTRKAIVGTIRATALSVALFLAGAVVPVLGGIAMVLTPAPVVFHAVGRLHADLRALVVVALATALVTLVAGPVAGVIYCVTFGLAGIVMCWMLEQRYPFEAIVMATAGAMLTAGTASALALTDSPDALLSLLRETLTAGMSRGSEFYARLGIKGAAAADLQASVLDLTIRLSPALAAISAGLTAFVNLMVFWRRGGKDRLSYTLFGELNKWSAPEWLIWVLLATGFAYQGFKYLIPIRPIDTIALDAFLCVATVYFCQGLAILSYYFRVLTMPAVARGAVYLITCVQPVLAALVCVAGVLDMWIDFRRLKPPSQEAGSFGDFL